MEILKKLAPIASSAVVLIYVVLETEAPSSLTSASLTQLIIFLLPLFTFFASLVNFYFNFWPKSLVFGLGTVFLLLFKALEMLNIVSFALTGIAIFLIIRSLKRPKQQSLKQNQIPNLGRLKKQ